MRARRLNGSPGRASDVPAYERFIPELPCRKAGLAGGPLDERTIRKPFAAVAGQETRAWRANPARSRRRGTAPYCGERMATHEDRLRGGRVATRSKAGAAAEPQTPSAVAAQRMESLGRLAAGISHDFRNLLTAILGNVHLMLEDEVVEARVGDVLRETLDAAGAGAEIVSQLTRFSRPSTGSATADLVVVVDRLIELLKRFVGEDVHIQRTLARGPLQVPLDAGQIEQIVMNLVFNARDAMPGGGELRVHVSRQGVTAEDESGSGPRRDVLGRAIPPGEYAVLSISDDGAGIAPELRAHVFEPFFSTKDPAEGTRGLGLSTVYGIVTGAGGRIALRSTVDKGTIITAYLPLASASRIIDVRDPVPEATLETTEDEG